MFGYTAEEHVVRTEDGYLLGIHRLAWRKGEEERRVNRGPTSVRKKVVYLHHGLLMNSEVWVCLTDEQRALPFALVEKGFDVWVGNLKMGCRGEGTWLIISLARKQQGQQVLEKVDPIFPHDD